MVFDTKLEMFFYKVRPSPTVWCLSDFDQLDMANFSDMLTIFNVEVGEFPSKKSEIFSIYNRKGMKFRYQKRETSVLIFFLKKVPLDLGQIF